MMASAAIAEAVGSDDSLLADLIEDSAGVDSMFLRLGMYLLNTTNIKQVYYFSNYILFCLYYSIAHGTVDSVLAFASTELGNELGSLSGFLLYITYTISALVLAKPLLCYFGPKHGVFFGLCGLLCYVSGFFIALLFPSMKYPIFLTGAGVGGIGAGVLWTSQGDYYTMNAILYANSANKNVNRSITNFASIFCGFYLFFETIFKLLATAIYFSVNKNVIWKPIVFGLYTVSAVTSVIAYYFHISILDGTANHRSVPTWSAVKTDIVAVTAALSTNKKLQLLMPYQICFGLSAGFVGYYVNSYVVSTYIGDGYIGFLSSLSTFTAVALAIPYAQLGNQLAHGKYYIMIFGGICFFFAGFPLLIFSDETIANWGFIVLYFAIHGAARGAWESTNKAVISEYFRSAKVRDVAFASVYFTSGFAGAIGYLAYQYMSRWQSAILNIIVPAIAVISFYWSDRVNTIEYLSMNTRVNDNDSDEDSNSLQ